MIAAHFTFEQATSYYYADSTQGDKLAKDLYAKFGLIRLQSNVSEREVAIMSKSRQVIEAKDYKGLTFRGDGYGPLVLQEPEFGASGVMLATADVYTALQTGVIDACEIGNAFGNYALGIQEITKYWTFPGMQQLCQVSSVFMALDSWNALPQDIQWIIIENLDHNFLRNWAFSHVESARIVPVLQSKWGITINRLSPDCQYTWKVVSWRLADAYGQKDAPFGVMWQNMKDHINLLAPYEKLQEVTYPAGKS